MNVVFHGERNESEIWERAKRDIYKVNSVKFVNRKKSFYFLMRNSLGSFTIFESRSKTEKIYLEEILILAKKKKVRGEKEQN